MKNHAAELFVLLAIGSISVSALAATPGIDLGKNVGYVIDSRGDVVKSGSGLCWRTGYWTPTMAIAECDPDLVKQAPKAQEVAKVEPPQARPEPAKPTPKPTSEKITLAADTLFDFDKSVLRQEGKAKLDELVGELRSINLEVIIAVGHADRFGTDKYNLALSDNRAQAVKAYLVSKGIEPNRIQAEGRGKKEPVTKPGQCNGPKTKKVIACLQPDRRVEIEVIGTKTVHPLSKG